jgi:hypothetical protein
VTIYVVSPLGDRTFPLVNGNAGAITQGQAVYLAGPAANTVDLASAAADNALARLMALVFDAAIAPAASGTFVYDGPAVGRFAPALVLAVGNEVFLSATVPGSLTNVAPAGAGQVPLYCGTIKNLLTYNGVGDLLAELMLETAGPKRVNP